MKQDVFLRKYISALLESKVKTRRGVSVPYGSRKHLAELDRVIGELDFIRRNMKRSERKERYTVSRAIDSLRHMKRKAERFAAKNALLSEKSFQKKVKK
tara:strand:+ start:204 stop:500 length:297 start_codon:yes stop_codon:yes gene_type:complete